MYGLFFVCVCVCVWRFSSLGEIQGRLNPLSYLQQFVNSGFLVATFCGLFCLFSHEERLKTQVTSLLSSINIFLEGNWTTKTFRVSIKSFLCTRSFVVVGVAYKGKDSVFRFIIEYNRLREIWPLVNNKGLFLYEDFWKMMDDILACVETWD